MPRKNELKFGFPIGPWQGEMIELLRVAGYEVEFSEELQKLEIDDPEIKCVLTRPVPMASFVAKGILDAGISTQASVLEAKVKVEEVCDLEYSKPMFGRTKLVVAVPQSSSIKSISGLAGKEIITRTPNIAKEFFRKNKISAVIRYSDASINEPMAGVVADAIIEFTRSGELLKSYNLRSIATILETSVILIANKNVLKKKWQREKIQDLAILLKGARVGQEMVGLMLHAANEIMGKVLKILSGMRKPTVTQLRGENRFDVLTVANKKETRKLIPKLKEIGCTDIVEFPLDKVIP